MLSKAILLPVKFTSGFIYREEKIYQKIKGILKRKYGNIDFESEKLNFDFTNYYCQELDKPLFRRFISFEKLRNPEYLPRLKLSCVRIEKKNSFDNKRKINIDPGYVNESKLVLATTKDFYHRIYLGQGIYAEVTLYYTKKKFCDFPTTYHDYRTPEYKKIFIAIRELYRRQLHNNGTKK